MKGQGSKLVISRVIIRVTPFRALISLLITYLLSLLPLQVPKPDRRTLILSDKWRSGALQLAARTARPEATRAQIL